MLRGARATLSGQLALLVCVLATLGATGCAARPSGRVATGSTHATSGVEARPRQVAAYPPHAASAARIDRLVPLADATCAHDDECAVVAAGRDAWCSFEGGVVVAVGARAEAKTRRNLDALPLGPPTVGAEQSLCPTALARCSAGACDLEWDWAGCVSDADCVRVEIGPAAGEPLVNACRVGSARRLVRTLLADRGGEARLDAVRILSSGVSCQQHRCAALP